MCTLQTSALPADSLATTTSDVKHGVEEPPLEYGLLTLHQTDNSLDIHVLSKANADKWTSDLRKLALEERNEVVTSIKICSRQDEAEIPVQLLTTLLLNIPTLQHLECDVCIAGSEEEFREWADALRLHSGNFTRVFLRNQKAATKMESCLKWEPVIVSLLRSHSNLQALQVDWKNNKTDTSSFSADASLLILQQMEGDPNTTITLDFPLFFSSIQQAARYYMASRRSNAVITCTSSINEESFMGRFFQSHSFPELPECAIDVTQTHNQNEESSIPIVVNISKRQIADPDQVQRDLQRLLGRNIQVTPPRINGMDQLKLLQNPNYLKSRFLYSQFPEELWQVQVTQQVQPTSAQYQQMVTFFAHGPFLLGTNDALTALFQWFSARPNSLSQLNY